MNVDEETKIPRNKMTVPRSSSGHVSALGPRPGPGSVQRSSGCPAIRRICGSVHSGKNGHLEEVLEC